MGGPLPFGGGGAPVEGGAEPGDPELGEETLMSPLTKCPLGTLTPLLSEDVDEDTAVVVDGVGPSEVVVDDGGAAAEAEAMERFFTPSLNAAFFSHDAHYCLLFT